MDVNGEAQVRYEVLPCNEGKNFVFKKMPPKVTDNSFAPDHVRVALANLY